MKKGIFIISVLSILISQPAISEYMINIPLEPQSIVIDDAEVTGSIQLNPSTINRGQSSNIEWDYTYGDTIDIEDVGRFENKKGSVSVSPLTSRSYHAEITHGSKSRNEVLNLTVIQPHQNISFNASSTRIGYGQSSLLDWDVSNSYGIKISNINDNNLPLNGYREVYPTSSTSYTLTATGYEGVSDQSETLNIEVVPNAVINSFETDKTKITTGNNVLFSWNVSNAEELALNPFGPLVQKVSGTQSIPFNTAGSFYYTLEATSLSGVQDTRTKTIEVFNPATITSFNANGPPAVFANAVFNLNWTANGANRYTIKSNNANSGVTTAEEDLGTSLTKSATPTTIGSYTYTLAAYNEANAKTEQNKVVSVEADPTFTGFTVNGQTSISVSPNAALSFIGSGFSAGATLQGRNSGNTSDATLPTTANSTAGTTTYYASASKTLNSVTRYSTARSVDVTVVNAPTIGTITAPTTVFASSAFTASWSGSNVTNYKIHSHNASAGISTTDVDLGTATSISITPTAAGTYDYTITATNTVGVTSKKTFVVTVEANPTFTGFTVNNSANISVSPATALTFAGSGFSAGSSLQGRNSANTSDATLPTTAPTSFGSYIYYSAAEKTVNSITRYSGLRSVVVNVVENWVAIAPAYTAWTNSGGVYNCTAWSPAASTVTINQSFTQTRSCSQAQTRTRQDREQEEYTKQIRNVGSPVTESQVITVSQSQAAKGTKETWVAASPTYTSWVNSGGRYGCTNWSPDPSTVDSGVTFTQTATDCEQNQTRTRQNREQETTTLAYRNVGSPVNESRTLTGQSSSRTATGTKSTYVYNSNTGAACGHVRYNNQIYVRSVIIYGGVEVYMTVAPGCTLSTGKSVAGSDGRTYVVGAQQGTGANWSVMRK